MFVFPIILMPSGWAPDLHFVFMGSLLPSRGVELEKMDQLVGSVRYY